MVLQKAKPFMTAMAEGKDSPCLSV